MRDDDRPSTKAPTSPPREAGPPPPAHFALVASAQVRAAIVGRLRLRRVPDQELEDLAGDVELALLAMAGVPPTAERCVAAARDLADKRAVSRVRSLTSRAKYGLGLTPDADEHAGDVEALPIAPATFVREEKLLLFEASLTDGTVEARTAKMMRLQAQGRSVGEIARRLGVAPQTVSNALAAGRRDVRAAWQTRAAQLGLA
jgi:DNA-directed RNA polymerase specialized sigma24 family protein